MYKKICNTSDHIPATRTNTKYILCTIYWCSSMSLAPTIYNGDLCGCLWRGGRICYNCLISMCGRCWLHLGDL